MKTTDFQLDKKHFLSQYTIKENPPRRGWWHIKCDNCDWNMNKGYWNCIGYFTDHAIEKHNPNI